MKSTISVLGRAAAPSLGGQTHIFFSRYIPILLLYSHSNFNFHFTKIPTFCIIIFPDTSLISLLYQQMAFKILDFFIFSNLPDILAL